MKIEVKQCSCGEVVRKDYTKAVIIVKGFVNYYSWRCENCGQEYLEKLKEPIILNENN